MEWINQHFTEDGFWMFAKVGIVLWLSFMGVLFLIGVLT